MQVVDEEIRAANWVGDCLERSLVLRDEAASRCPVTARNEDVLRPRACASDSIDRRLQRQLEVVDVEILRQIRVTESAWLGRQSTGRDWLTCGSFISPNMMRFSPAYFLARSDQVLANWAEVGPRGVPTT